MSELLARPFYLQRALSFRDTDLVKVVTGLRRCGKSSLLALVRESLQAEGLPDSSFVTLNLEDIGLGINTGDDLYDYCKAHLNPTGRTYIFLDEIQRIEGWHDAVNAMRVAFDCDLYVTGSNAFLLSSELSTYLSGRYVEVRMLPLSFEEYVYFCGVKLNARRTAGVTLSGEIVTCDDLMSRYLTYGGMPAIANLDVTQGMHEAYMAGLYDAVVVRDIFDRERHASKRLISSRETFDRLTRFLADNVGNQCSANSIANALESRGARVSRDTVASYLTALTDAYVFYPCERYDIHGKALLRTLPKYFLADVGIRSYLEGYRPSDVGRVFENAVFHELLYRGWSVHVGKLYGKEVDFVAVRDGRVVYLQVTDELFAEETRKRELDPLRSIRDNHEKAVIVRQGTYERDVDGIRILTPSEFFFGEYM